MRHRVILSLRAQAELATRGRWWRKNRPYNPQLLRQEVGDALDLLAQRPEAGAAAENAGPYVRKILLPRTQCYVYYRVDRAERIVLILSFWHTARLRPPQV